MGKARGMPPHIGVSAVGPPTDFWISSTHWVGQLLKWKCLLFPHNSEMNQSPRASKLDLSMLLEASAGRNQC